MYETMLTRHTTMIVGPTGGGKSVVINTLAQAQTRFVLTSENFVILGQGQFILNLVGNDGRTTF